MKKNMVTLLAQKSEPTQEHLPRVVPQLPDGPVGSGARVGLGTGAGSGDGPGKMTLLTT